MHKTQHTKLAIEECFRFFGRVIQEIYPKAPCPAPNNHLTSKKMISRVRFPLFCFLGHTHAPTFSLLLEAGRSVYLLPQGASWASGSSTEGRSSEIWTVWGTGVTCENTVTYQDHYHFREVNMGQEVSEPGHDKKLISNVIVAGCWALAQQVSIQPQGLGVSILFVFCTLSVWH